MDEQNSVSAKTIAGFKPKDSPYRWHPLLFFTFVLSNSKGRLRLIVKPSRDIFPSADTVGFEIRLAANQGRTRVSSTMVEDTLGAPLDVGKCKELGHMLHAAQNNNFQSIKKDGLLLAETRQPGQTSRITIHFVYAGGSVPPREGTHIATGHRLF